MKRALTGLVILVTLLAACETAPAADGDAAAGESPAVDRFPPASTASSTVATFAPAGNATTSITRAPAPPTTAPIPRHTPDDLAIREDHDVAVPGGLPADVFFPADPGPWPVAITIHGGGWVSGRKEDLAGLARTLARHGVVVFNVEYRPLERDGAFPQMFQEVACALAFAETRSADYGGGPPTTLVGFSAGAHIGAVVALAPEEFSAECIEEPSPVAGFVGISGPYDSDQFPFLALQFGGLRTEIPEAWATGNPYTYLGRNPDVSVLMLHGGRDPVVDPEFSVQFAAALDSGGYSVKYRELDGVGHFSIVDMAENGRPTADAIAHHVWELAGG